MSFPPFRSEIANRIFSALALLPLVVWLLWRGGWCSALLLASAGGLAAREYYRLTLGRLALPGWLGVAGAAVLPTLPLVLPGFAATAPLAVIGLVSVAAWIHHVLLGPRAEGPTRVGHIVAGLLFISLGLLALSALRAGPDLGLGLLTSIFNTPAFVDAIEVAVITPGAMHLSCDEELDTSTAFLTRPGHRDVPVRLHLEASLRGQCWPIIPVQTLGNR